MPIVRLPKQGEVKRSIRGVKCITHRGLFIIFFLLNNSSHDPTFHVIQLLISLIHSNYIAYVKLDRIEQCFHWSILDCITDGINLLRVYDCMFSPTVMVQINRLLYYLILT